MAHHGGTLVPSPDINGLPVGYVVGSGFLAKSALCDETPSELNFLLHLLIERFAAGPQAIRNNYHHPTLQDAAFLISNIMTTEVSHGRGGAGNIEPDDTPYVDGELVRQGEEGSHADGPFSTGRGGAANIGDAGKASEAAARTDKLVVPEEATRPSSENTDFHTGRGGAGNEHLAPSHETTKATGGVGNTSVADKLKNKVFGIFKK